MTSELVPVEAQPLINAKTSIAMVDEASKMAQKLGAVIKSQKLTSKIQGKDYVRCEGWTTLGAMMGVFPHIVWTRPLEDGGGWEARCEVKRPDGAVLGAAEAQCGMDEQMWAGRSSFARRSMAQTRATSKAMRVVFSWVMTLAGYEATPAEEMDFDQKPPQRSAEPKKAAPRRAPARQAEPLAANGGAGPADDKQVLAVFNSLVRKFATQKERVYWLTQSQGAAAVTGEALLDDEGEILETVQTYDQASLATLTSAVASALLQELNALPNAD